MGFHFVIQLSDFYFLAVTSEDLVEQDSPIIAVVYLPAANDDVEILKKNGKKRA